MHWSQPAVSGSAPPPTFKHTATVVGTKMMLLGGMDGPGLHVFDTETYHWTVPTTTGNAPASLKAHSAVLVGERIFVFGGGDGANYSADLYILDIKTMHWTKVVQSEKSGAWPCARRAHSASLYGNRMIVFGGGASGKALNDAWALDTDKLAWTALRQSSTPPKGRGFHTAALADGTLLLYGGSDAQECFTNILALDVEKQTWSEKKVFNSMHRYSHTATLAGPWMFVVGGCDGSNYVDTVDILNLQTMEFMKKPCTGPPPSPRGYHSTVYCNSRLWLFGGFDQTTTYADLHCLDLGIYAYLPSMTSSTKLG